MKHFRGRRGGPGRRAHPKRTIVLSQKRNLRDHTAPDCGPKRKKEESPLLLPTDAMAPASPPPSPPSQQQTQGGGLCICSLRNTQHAAAV
ncbi:hypothetical protein EYF80_006699 [Liparis tanakae]|uniref:Uncharacterized protein n=1 Tax=Liparis tanakae TaxID=230148 RepID=A0A4Z2J0M7_9TELE|nr:hypothetical protein EYF80_006699 [Liparis tanakae]